MIWPRCGNSPTHVVSHGRSPRDRTNLEHSTGVSTRLERVSHQRSLCPGDDSPRIMSSPSGPQPYRLGIGFEFLLTEDINFPTADIRPPFCTDCRLPDALRLRSTTPVRLGRRCFVSRDLRGSADTRCLLHVSTPRTPYRLSHLASAQPHHYSIFQTSDVGPSYCFPRRMSAMAPATT